MIGSEKRNPDFFGPRFFIKKYKSDYEILPPGNHSSPTN